MFLLPLPATVAKNPVDDVDIPPRPTPNLRPNPKKKARPSPKTKSMCPQELKGFKQLNASNIPICWAFNLSSGCSEAVSNGNASSATDRIMVWPLVEWLRKTDMRRSAERLTHFLKAVLMQTLQHLTVLLRVMEFKNLLNMQQYHLLQERK